MGGQLGQIGMSRFLRGWPGQLLLVTILPLSVMLIAISLGSVFLHQRSMRQLVSERDMRAVMATAQMLENIAQRNQDRKLDLTPSEFSMLVNPMSEHQQVTAIIVDPSGRSIYHTDAKQIDKNWLAHGGVTEALRGDHGVVYAVDDATVGEEHVISYSPIHINGGRYALIIEEPWAQVVDPMMQYSMIVPLILLPVLLLAFLGLVLGMRRIVHPLQRLGQLTTQATTGNLKALAQPLDGIEEITQLQRTLNAMARQIEADKARLRRYADAITEAQEEERKRLARELHDDTIQHLIVLSQRLQSARIASQKGQVVDAAQLDALRAEVVRMIDDVRRFSRALRPIYLEEAGLVASLERMACEAHELAQTAAPASAVRFSAEGDVLRLKPDVEMALFRIAQEAVNNALKHAHARNVDVGIETKEGVVRLCVHDDGHGFPSPVASADSDSDRMGVIGMRERARLIGARITISSDADAGTQVEVVTSLTNTFNIRSVRKPRQG